MFIMNKAIYEIPSWELLRYKKLFNNKQLHEAICDELEEARYVLNNGTTILQLELALGAISSARELANELLVRHIKKKRK